MVWTESNLNIYIEEGEMLKPSALLEDKGYKFDKTKAKPPYEMRDIMEVSELFPP